MKRLLLSTIALTATLTINPNPTQAGPVASRLNALVAAPNVTTNETAIYNDQRIGAHPHPIDFYVPKNATSAIVFLHGGGGTKEDFANILGLKADKNPTTPASAIDWEWLQKNKVIAIFPQGGAVAGTKSYTWDNYMMKSERDDMSLLRDLVGGLRSGTLGLPKINRVYVFGHSNGGIMVNRLWCEAPELFDAYASASGPLSSHLDPATGDKPCRPSVAKPYLGIIGSEDEVLQDFVSKGNWEKPVWYLSPVVVAISSKKTFTDAQPALLNELRSHQNIRSERMCGRVSSPQAGYTDAAGVITLWTDCNDTIQLTRVNGAPHAVKGMEEKAGVKARDALVYFLFSPAVERHRLLNR